MHLMSIIIVLSASIISSYGLLSSTGHKYLTNEFNKIASSLNFSSVETKWITQPLDHFNNSDKRKWNMKYYQNLDKWKPGGPIYIYIGGEGPAIQGCISYHGSGIMEDIATETYGAMLSSEHRYYGESQPLRYSTVENLQYLSSRQALADLANLVKDKKLSPAFSSSKVVVIGGSYAGSLAAWMRLLYPDVIDAAISISGPVLAKANFFEYLEIVGDDFKRYTTAECFNNIIAKFNRFKTLLKSESGIRQLKEEEMICDETNMSKWENQQYFLLAKMNPFSYTAQYGDPESIKNFCAGLGDISYEHSLTSNSEIFDKSGYCWDYNFDNWSKEMNKDDLSWIYQTCTEFGFFQVSPQSPPFSNVIDINLYYKLCSAVFGPNFNATRIAEGVKKTNEMYNGLNPNVTNVVFINGEIDPWHRLGIVRDLSVKAQAKVIPRASHCPVLIYRPQDSEETKTARTYIKSLIKQWIETRY